MYAGLHHGRRILPRHDHGCGHAGHRGRENALHGHGNALHDRAHYGRHGHGNVLHDCAHEGRHGRGNALHGRVRGHHVNDCVLHGHADLIYVGYNRLLPGNLSDGMLVCAAIIGIFPVIKNALLECISRRRISIELVIGAVLLTGLFTGRFLEVAIAALLMLVGSFMRINFSWRS